MSRVFQPLFFYLATCLENELVRQIEFLRAENEMLRQRVPKKRIFLKPNERQRLIELGKAIGPGLRHLITIVTYESWLRWIRSESNDQKPERMGRPRTAQFVRELILRLAQETGWGYTRIMGELKKLGTKPPSRSTVKNILRDEGHDPGPKRGQGSWDEFLKRHADTLWQCDFFSKRIWTPTGLRQYFVLAFLHLGSRRVFITKASRQPDSVWMEKQSHAFLKHARTEELGVGIVMRDRDSKFGSSFDSVLRDSDAKVLQTAHRSPNQNAFIERWIQSIKQECLDQFIVFGEDHFNYLIAEYVEHYLTERPHQSCDNRPLIGSWPEPSDDNPPDLAVGVACKTRLGGVLRHYYRQAA